MRYIADIASKALSVLLYPLFVPTYGMALFCYVFHTHVLPLPVVWHIIAIGGTLLLTCVLPVTAIGILIRHGKVTDMQIANAGERTLPYLYATLGFGFWAYFLLSILHAPLYIGLVGIGATVAIALVAFINRFWKISAHLTGLGGLFGGMMSYCIGVGVMPSWGFISIGLLLSLILMYTRVYLNAHTPAQVCAGWLLGISCSFLPYYIALHVA